MPAYGFTLFDTTIGRCGIAWSERGIVRVQLPEVRDAETRKRLLQRHPDAQEVPPTKDVQGAVAGIVGLLRGQAIDLAGVPLDMDGVPQFHRRVYAAARTIAPGATLSYGQIATRLGSPGSARAVGQALGRNPFAIVVPCHRVLAAHGKVGGFSAGGGITTKLRLLTIERAAHITPGLFDGEDALGFDRFDRVVGVEYVRAADAALARVIDAVGPLRLEVKHTASIFGALAEAIVYQQLSGKAAATIFARVCALFPQPHEGPKADQILRVSDAKLRGAGLSQAKMLALRDLSHRSVDGQIPTVAQIHRMDDEAIIECLTEVRGIGRWTAEMLLIFRLGRPDVLPLDDYGIQKGFAIAFNKHELPARKDLEKRGARWQPYRTVASWYLWRAAELPNKRGMS